MSIHETMKQITRVMMNHANAVVILWKLISWKYKNKNKMKFRELHDLCNSICEYHWEGKELTVIVNDYEFNDFMKVLKKYRGIFEYGIEAFIGDGYISIPRFEKYLEMMGVDEEEFKEIFEE